MVLVSDKPSNDIDILQTKLSDRERHETRRVGLEAMPLDEHIEGRHGEGQARLQIGPAPVHDLVEMADERVLSQITENRKVDPHKPLIFQYTIFRFCPQKATLRQSPAVPCTISGCV